MRDKFIYEWVIRTFDESDDIIDNDFDESLNGYWADDMYNAIVKNDQRALELVKYIGNDIEGTKAIEYAEIRNGHLEPEFSDGSRVPRRFHAELAKVIAKLQIKDNEFRYHH